MTPVREKQQEMDGGVKVPFELLIEAGHQQLMFLCVSALLMSHAGKLALQFL